MLPWSEETPKAGVSTGTQLLNTGGGGGQKVGFWLWDIP